MERVGLVGLGIMGTAFSSNLLRNGFDVVGYDVAADRMDELEAAGGASAESPAAVAAQCEAVITALPSVNAFDEVVAGGDGLAAGARPGLTLIEMSTFPLEAKETARAALEPSGVAVIDAPVSGTGLQAAAAEVVIYASGDAGAIEVAGPIFAAIGKQTFDLGPFGNGSRMKFLANLLVSVHNLATAEAFVLGMKAGLDPQQIQDVLSAGVGSSRIFEIRGPMMVADTYEPAAARMKMFIKDVGVITDFARSLGVPTPLLDASRPLYEEAVEAGLGEQDAAALCTLLEERAGVVR
jgi:3-hydroxyisobutyrate dehydrogenase-like beta-hydroxyacid dehydrogenase